MDTKKSASGPQPEARALGEAHLITEDNYTPNVKKSLTGAPKEQRALWWLERDFLLLPVQPNSKKIVSGFGPYQDAIKTPERVAMWFSERSLANLTVCGTQTSLILDFDDPDLYRSWARQFPDAARTYTEQTPRGGYHVFAHAWYKDLQRVALIKGVELKRVVLVAPSVVDNKPYIHGAGELLDLDATLVLSPLSQTPISPRVARVNIHAKSRLQKIKSAFSCLALIQSARPGLRVPQSSKRFITVACPFHDDKEPSCWVDTVRNLWGCHACGTRGDVINLYARLKGLSVTEAIREMGATL